MIVKGEALIRLEAERRLLAAFRAEYERLLKRTDHVRAVRALVKSHKRAYDVAMSEARIWALPLRGRPAATRAA
jgi:membrane glycosyltransferase